LDYVYIDIKIGSFYNITFSAEKLLLEYFKKETIPTQQSVLEVWQCIDEEENGFK
jgi:hypothetical protein